jgi:hypothetical protein
MSWTRATACHSVEGLKCASNNHEYDDRCRLQFDPNTARIYRKTLNPTSGDFDSQKNYLWRHRESHEKSVIKWCRSNAYDSNWV